jgi:hypothetical protein
VPNTELFDASPRVADFLGWRYLGQSVAGNRVSGDDR